MKTNSKIEEYECHILNGTDKDGFEIKFINKAIGEQGRVFFNIQDIFVVYFYF